MRASERIGNLEFQVKELCREVEKLRLTQCSILGDLECLEHWINELKEKNIDVQQKET